MELGFVGLGRMGANMVGRLRRADHQIVAYDRDAEAVGKVERHGAIGAKSIEDLVKRLSAPRAVWIMVPSGKPTEETVAALAPRLSSGDTVIDGGNSNYRDSIRRAGYLKEKGFFYVDVGTSGGVWGLKEGYSLMIGGDPKPVDRLKPVFQTLAPAPDRGWGHVGPSGAGHFVKMVHNGIEYGLMQAYAEGFSILKAKAAFGLDPAAIAEIWRHGSVVRSWLLDLTAQALSKDPALGKVRAWVEDSGEGRWTVQEAIDLNVSAPVITESLLRRIRSREDDPFADKLLAAMRQAFGGHAIKED